MSKPKAPKLPKRKCCVSSSRCKRCPVRMLRDGTLPEGYTVKRRRLVITGDVAATSKKSKKSTSKQSEQGKKRKDKRIRPIAA